VNDSEQAAMLLNSGKQYDFVVLDVHLPGQSGIELLKALRKMEKGRFCPHVIVATGDHSKVVQDYCAEEGVNRILHKPFAPDELCRRVLEIA
jgi:CheY-like chemotaxis protein